MRAFHIGLIAGWAHHADHMRPLADLFASVANVHVAAVGDWAPDFHAGLTTWVSGFPPGDVCLVGWSMGAIVVADALCRSSIPAVKAAVFVAGSARFTVADDYPHGWPMAHVRAMQRGIRKNPEETLRRFSNLVRYPDSSPKEVIQGVSLDQLVSGLDYLMETDLRSVITAVTIPTLCWHGAQDRVVPAGASEWLGKNMPHASLMLDSTAGHNCVVTHPQQIHREIANFLTGALA